MDEDGNTSCMSTLSINSQIHLRLTAEKSPSLRESLNNERDEVRCKKQRDFLKKQMNQERMSSILSIDSTPNHLNK